MKKFTSIVLGIVSVINLAHATSVENTPLINQVEKKAPSIEYKELSTGVEIIFSTDGSNWEKIMANGESELLFGDRKDVRKASSKAVLRAKASIAKFLKEKLTTEETLEEITKTISTSTGAGNTVLTGATRKTVETTIESISNSSEAILKGILVLEQKVNQKDKFVHVKLGVSRKTMRIADSISKDMNRDMTQPSASNGTAEKQYNNGESETRRSKNYSNF
jgi:hypothetical protein